MQDARPENQPRQENKIVYPLTYSVKLQDSKDLKKDSAHSSTHAVLQDLSDSTGLTYTVFEEGKPSSQIMQCQTLGQDIHQASPAAWAPRQQELEKKNDRFCQAMQTGTMGWLNQVVRPWRTWNCLKIALYFVPCQKKAAIRISMLLSVGLHWYSSVLKM